MGPHANFANRSGSRSGRSVRVAKNVCCLGKCQIIWDLSEIAAGVVLLHADGFEEKGFPFHLNLQKGQLPVAWGNFCLLDVKRTAFIQVPEQASAKFHLMDEVTGDSFYPRLLAVYPDISFRGMKDFGFARGWVKAWTGREVQLYEVTSALP
jgi:hypothetical protein